jgi:VAD1 Analog of StAR-related lipid transfer domain
MLLRVVLLILKATTLIVEQSMPQKYLDSIISPPLSSSCSPSSSLPDKNDAGGGGGTTEEHCHFPALVIPCQWENYQGILTAGAKGLVFTGSFFLFDTILSLPWTDVRRMHFAVPVLDTDDQPSLVVTMRKTTRNDQDREQQLQHVFARVPPAHLSRLMHLQNDALSSSRRRVVGSSSVVAGSGGTTTTDNTVKSIGSATLLMLDDEDDEMNEDDHTAATVTDCRSSTTVVTTSSVMTSLLAERMPDSIMESHTGLPLSLRDVTVSHDDTKARLYAGPNGLVLTGRRYFWDYYAVVIILPWSAIWKIHRPTAHTVLVQSHDARDYRLVVTDSNTAAVDEIWETLVSGHNIQLTQTIPGAKKKSQHHPPLSSSVKVARPETVETMITVPDTWSPLRHVVVSNVELPCSLPKFEDLFLRDQALYSLSHFLASRGDTELESTNWGDDSERVVRYIHPVNVPLAPPQARARKEQRLVRQRQRQQQHSPNSCADGTDDGDDDASTIVLIVETKTIVDDVPMTDCFYVLDRLTVTQQQQPPPVAVGGKATATTVQVRMEFEITFVKSTMFQGIIRTTTNREFTALFQSLAAYYAQCLVIVDPATSTTTTTSIERPSVQPDHKTNGSSSYGVAPLYYLLWGITVALQLWMLRELREIKAVLILAKHE